MIASITIAGTAGASLGALLRYYLPPFLTEATRSAWLPVVASGSAAGAVLAHASPTGLRLVDGLLAAAMGSSIVWSATSVRPRIVLFAGIAACLAGIGSVVHPVAFAASGLLLVAAFTTSRASFLNAVSSAMIVQVALRLSDPELAGLSAVAAAAILAPIVASGVAKLGPRARRRLRKTTVVVSLGAAVACALAGGAALAARSSMYRGMELLAVETGPSGDNRSTAAIADRFDSANRAFGRAEQALRWGRPASFVPIVAQHWSALHEAAVSGKAISAVGARVMASPTLEDLRIEEGRVPLAELVALRPILEEAVSTLRTAHRSLAGADSDWLVPALGGRIRDGTTRLKNAEAGVRTTLRLLPLLPALLGEPAPRRYFLMIQTPAELRATGGFMGNYGEITAEGGQLRLARFGRILELYPRNSGDVRTLTGPPDYLARYARFRPEQEMGNVNVSPDLPTVARVIQGLYRQAGGGSLDGVIAVDPSALAAFLRVVGPVQVPSWPEPITGENVRRILLFDQYQEIQSPERADFIGSIANEVWQRLTTASDLLPQQVFAALADAVRGKHLQVVSLHPEEEALLDGLGVSGRVGVVEGDFLAVITQNAGGNKLDAYLHRQIDYSVELKPRTRSLRARLRVTLHNRAPGSGLPAYVRGSPELSLPEGHNRLYISVYTPWALSRATMDGRSSPMAAENELGRRVYSTYAVIPAGGSTTLALDLEGRVTKTSQYLLRLHRQPTVEADDIRTAVAVPSGWVIGDTGARRWQSRRLLEDDEETTLPLSSWWR